VQDPYSFRCIQVHGASKDALEYGQKVFKTEINSVTDPNIFIDSDEIISGGNFHGQPGFSLRFWLLL
jgi:histidine ammonia-lyase